MKVRNPRTGEYDYEISLISAGDLTVLCNQQRAAQKKWQEAGIDYRAQALQDWKAVVTKYKPALIEALASDTGRMHETILEADLVASSIDKWCTIAKSFFAPSEKKQTAIPFIQLQQSLVAFDLIGVISPWNFPLLLSLIDTIPALLAGSAVIVKPSEVTPRFIKVIQQTIDEVPALKDILNYLEGDGTVGAALINECDLICFTGSTATGKKVYDAASKRMIPVFLELGGKDPVIVLEGANIDLATSAILWGSTVNAGQSCLSIERVYVQDSIFEAFSKLLAKKAANIRLAYPTMTDGEIGPIIFEKQVQIINHHLSDAIANGATILAGNESCENLGGGFYCKPTVLINVGNHLKIIQEETFGPVIPIISFKTKEEAISMANSTIYGLSGAVFAATNEEAISVAEKMIGGAISINDCALTAIMHEGEKNSFKLSGIGGTRMGPNAIKRFMRQKVFIIKETSVKDPWWFKEK